MTLPAADESLDLPALRAHFPALATDWALCDNAGGSVPCREVVDRIRAYMTTTPVQHGASYELSRRAAAGVLEARRAMARWIGAASPDEIVFGASSTMLVRTLADALAPSLAPGDEVVVTNLDHETNVGPWRALEARGVAVREWRCDPASARLRPEDLDPLLNARTRVVAFAHVSNIVGAIHDAAEIIRRVHAAGALAVVDGVAYAPHRRVDVRALDADFYFLSAYKTFGPHIGLLYGKRALLERAGRVNHFFVADDAVPTKLEPGNACYELAASLPGIVEYLESLAPGDGALDRAHARIVEHEAELARPLLEWLDAQPRVRVIGPSTAAAHLRVPTVSFTVAGLHASAVPARLDEHRVAVRYGHFYAYRLIRDLGLLEHGGVVRASLVHYNTPDEVARLIAALDATL